MDTTDELTGLGQDAVEAFDGLLKRALIEQALEQPLACKAGCAHCCHQPEITVTAIELFRVSDFIMAHYTDAQNADLIPHLASDAASALAAGQSWTLRACRLLIDGACSVYEARPLVCRSINAYDVSECETARSQNREQPIIRTYGPQERAGYLTIQMLQKGISATGREAAMLNLAPALAIALTDTDTGTGAKQRWLDGETVFKTAWATL